MSTWQPISFLKLTRDPEKVGKGREKRLRRGVRKTILSFNTAEVIRIFLGFDILLEIRSQCELFLTHPKAGSLCLENESKVVFSNLFQGEAHS